MSPPRAVAWNPDLSPEPAACVVLVHGLWHGPWCWDRVRRRLDAAGVASVAVDLPMTALHDDAAAVHRVLDRLDMPAVLVGHSYGGAVITVAGLHRAVCRLVYIAGFQLDVGESIGRVVPEADIAATQLDAALRFTADRRHVSIDPALARDLLYGQAPRTDIDSAIARLRPVDRGLFGSRVQIPAWRTVPSTYAVCTEDLTVAPGLQRAMAQRATEVVEWVSDHSPQASHPDLVAELLIRTAQEG